MDFGGRACPAMWPSGHSFESECRLEKWLQNLHRSFSEALKDLRSPAE